MKLGTVQEEVDTSSFSFRAVEEVRKFDFVSVKSDGNWILAQVEEVTKHPDGKTVADANIIGYREKGLTKAPRRVIEPDSIVYRADQDLISDTLGLHEDGLRIGNLETDDDIDIFIEEENLYTHYAVLARTGAGKSYLNSVLIEEMLESDFPVVILDPHGEYSSLSQPNPESDDPRSYTVREYSPNTNVNSHAEPLRFSSENLTKQELTTVIPDSLTNSQMGVLYNAMKRLQEDEEDYDLSDIEEAVNAEESSAKWNLLNYLDQVEDTGLFGKDSVRPRDLVNPGEATIINLKAVESDATEIAAYKTAKELFELRKKDLIPPFVMVLEEAHNFVPEQSYGKALSNDIIRKIASEGRKFGMGLGVISQRPARIDKNVLSQCNSQFILRLTNPNDLKAVSKSFEGVNKQVESMIKSLPSGVCFVLGNEHPVMTQVRTRHSKHGGDTETNEDYVEKQEIRVFEPAESLESFNSGREESFQQIYYPLLKIEREEKNILMDLVNGEKRSELSMPDKNPEKKVVDLLKEGKDKSGIVEELDLNLGKLSSMTDRLKNSGVIKDNSWGLTDSLLLYDIERETVPANQLIEQNHESEGLVDEEDQSSQVVYVPYFSNNEEVYNPVTREFVS